MENVRALRVQCGMNQSEFWGLVGVTQSGGSRYESGRNMPKPVRELVRVVHVERIDLARLTRADAEVVAYLKATDKALYRKLLGASRAGAGRRKH